MTVSSLFPLYYYLTATRGNFYGMSERTLFHEFIIKYDNEIISRGLINDLGHDVPFVLYKLGHCFVHVKFMPIKKDSSGCM